MDPVQRTIDEAAKLLLRKGAFCQGHWLVFNDPEQQQKLVELTGNNIDTNQRASFEGIKQALVENGASIANPNFQVCGQGALGVAAAMLGHDFDTYCEARDKVEGLMKERGVDASIPDYNDGPASGPDMAILFAASIDDNPHEKLKQSSTWRCFVEDNTGSDEDDECYDEDEAPF